jgi:hypothetical protein
MFCLAVVILLAGHQVLTNALCPCLGAATADARVLLECTVPGDATGELLWLAGGLNCYVFQMLKAAE